ncbi:MAG: glycosyltransferase family 9 protein [Ignavibacteriales bacterium]|nr:glycosyltransferase family 9 protein [Ignavibacteriales bacterium]
MNNKIPKCKKFTGYKPCHHDHNCWSDGCKECEPIGTKILIINLDAMGDVIMTTSHLVEIKNKYKESSIYWITLKSSAPLLENNPLLDKVFIYDFESLSILSQMKFDIVINLDKSMRAGALIMSIQADKKMGFGINEDGKIFPLNKGSEYNYLLGMDDHLKFRINKRTKLDYVAETMEIPFNKNDYIFNFYPEELGHIEKYKKENSITPNDKIIGFNTGCSNLFPNKKMTIEQHIELISRFLDFKKFKIVLLGGPEDTERNKIIYSYFEEKIILTPTTEGIRRGACYINIPQLIITGDSFGMHLAIALKKYIISWFGLSCWTEIELFDRGIKLYSENLECSPCWKKVCPYNLECIQQIDLDKMVSETLSYFERTF